MLATVKYIPCKNFQTKFWWLVKPKNVGMEIHYATIFNQIPSQIFSQQSSAFCGKLFLPVQTPANLCLSYLVFLFFISSA